MLVAMLASMLVRFAASLNTHVQTLLFKYTHHVNYLRKDVNDDNDDDLISSVGRRSGKLLTFGVLQDGFSR